MSDEPNEVELGPEGELPLGWKAVDVHGLTFREFAAINGEDKPSDEWPAADVAAWFLDHRE